MNGKKGKDPIDSAHRLGEMMMVETSVDSDCKFNQHHTLEVNNNKYCKTEYFSTELQEQCR